MQVIQTTQARAYSRDGRQWRMEVRAHLAAQHDTKTHTIPFAIWQADGGLTRLPVDARYHTAALFVAASELEQQLKRLARRVPFPGADRYEYWLMDDEQQPLALLASQCDGQNLQAPAEIRWVPMPNDDHSFVSASLHAHGIPNRVGNSPCFHRDQLIRQVGAAAARPCQAHWYERQNDGSARRLAHPSTATLAAAAFPPLLLREHWPSVEQQQLVDEFFAWQAPVLLTLPNLPGSTRRQLERAAIEQPMLVAALYNLYPEVLEVDLIERARVEARLRQANAQI